MHKKLEIINVWQIICCQQHRWLQDSSWWQ